MTENNAERLASIEALLTEQRDHQKKVLLHTRIRTICTLLCAVLLTVLFAQALSLMDTAAQTVKTVDAAVKSMDEVIQTVNEVDLISMAQSLDALIDSSGKVMSATEGLVRTANEDLTAVLRSFSELDIDRLNAGISGIASVDFASLNTSIQSLSAVMRPLSAFFGNR